jgi:hypothetical protein
MSQTLGESSLFLTEWSPFSIVPSTKKLRRKETETYLWLDSDSDAYSGDEGDEMLEEEGQVENQHHNRRQASVTNNKKSTSCIWIFYSPPLTWRPDKE